MAPDTVSILEPLSDAPLTTVANPPIDPVPKRNAERFDIRSGYVPGVLGRTLDMHMRYYSKHSKFGKKFELDLAAALENLLRRIDDPLNEVWTASQGNTIVATIFIDGSNDAEPVAPGGDRIAHLRAFIVDEGYQGKGIGKMLIDKAMEFVKEKDFIETKLWSFKGLDAARSLYERSGFVLTEERLGTRWGEEVTEQLFIRRRVGTN